MAITEAHAGYGVVLTVGGVPIAKITNISGPSMSRDSVDVTTMDSITNMREFMGGLADGGEVTLDIVFNTAVASTVYDHTYDKFIVAETGGNTPIEIIVITFTDDASVTWTFNAFCTAFSPEAPVDGAVTASITFKVTGIVTVA